MSPFLLTNFLKGDHWRAGKYNSRTLPISELIDQKLTNQPWHESTFLFPKEIIDGLDGLKLELLKTN